MQNREEKLEFLAGRLREALAARAEMEVPENGKFRKISASINVPETENSAYLIAEHDEINPKDTRRLSIGVKRQNRDSMRTSYIFKGTKKELIEYLKNSDNQEKIIKTINQLSDSTDSYYASM